MVVLFIHGLVLVQDSLVDTAEVCQPGDPLVVSCFRTLVHGGYPGVSGTASRCNLPRIIPLQHSTLEVAVSRWLSSTSREHGQRAAHQGTAGDRGRPSIRQTAPSRRDY